MPKSKVRKRNNKVQVQRRTKPMPYAQHQSSPANEYIVQAGTLRAGSQTLTLPTPLVIKGELRANKSEIWEASDRPPYVAIGGSDSFLKSLSEEAQDILTHCAPNQTMRETYAELFAWGYLRVEQMETPRLRYWLDEHYLGTWEDPTFAVGAFLRDMEKTSTIPDHKRRIAYERLAQMAEITEIPLGNGRTIVFLDRDFDEMRRFLANQYMIHGSMPEVIGLG
jgi:hypothetical protein